MGVVYLLLRSLLVVNGLRLIFVCLRVVCGLCCVIGFVANDCCFALCLGYGFVLLFCCLFAVMYVVVLRGF